MEAVSGKKGTESYKDILQSPTPYLDSSQLARLRKIGVGSHVSARPRNWQHQNPEIDNSVISSQQSLATSA